MNVVKLLVALTLGAAAGACVTPRPSCSQQYIPGTNSYERCLDRQAAQDARDAADMRQLGAQIQHDFSRPASTTCTSSTDALGITRTTCN